jgi:DNA-binding CsgD family transcriptional regulator
VAARHPNSRRAHVDVDGHERALGHILAGELDAAQRAHDEASSTNSDGARAHPVALAVGTRLAYLRDDDAAADQYVEGSALDAALCSPESRHVALVAGCAAAYLQTRGRTGEAWELRRRALVPLDGTEGAYWLLDQMAASPDEDVVARARALLDGATRGPDRLSASAHLALFDGRLLLLQGRREAARTLAREAAERFEALGRPWERAQAFEVAGERARALAIYEHLGCTRDAKRVTRARRRARHRPSTTHLTQRELEVARLASDGLSNRAIAEALFIGERTVETHITAIFERFHLTSRKELPALLQRLQVAPAQP